MTHEERKPNSEQSTEKYEVSVPNMVCTSATNRESLQRKGETSGSEFAGKHSYENVMFRKSAFVPVRTNTLSNGLPDSLKASQKRKLQSSNSEILEWSLNLNDARGKRFKPNESQYTYEGNGLLGELRQPFCCEREPIYYNSSLKQNAYSKLNGFSEDASRKLDFNFNAFSRRDYLGMFGNPKDALARIVPEEIETTNLQTNPVDLRNSSIRVGEAELRRHSVRNVPSVSKNIQPQGNTRVEHQKHKGNSAGCSHEFISLDSTKSSFLTLITKMRQTKDIIPCPFCSQSFSKYPDLKLHVQTHKYGNISNNGDGMREVQPSSNQHQSLSSPSGNTLPTPVSSPATLCPRPPNRRLSTTSVIQFAEKKSNDCTEK